MGQNSNLSPFLISDGSETAVDRARRNRALSNQQAAAIQDPVAYKLSRDVEYQKSLSDSGLKGTGTGLKSESVDVGTNQNQYNKAGVALGGAAELTKNTGTEGGDVATGALSGAAAGAAIGSVLPGYGTAIGAGVGAVVGTTGALLSQRSKRKKEKAEAESQKFLNIAKIEDDTEIKRQNAMTNMVTALRSAFLGS